MTDSQIDWDALDALYQKARRADVGGDNALAARLYSDVVALDPDDHLGATLRLAHLEGNKPEKAPSAYVAALFDQTADSFDRILVDELGYSVPLMIADRLKERELGPFEGWLDLGCGTGLCAMALEDVTTHRTGIDLAPSMIEIASELEIYDRLLIGEVISFLTSETVGGPYKLITAADVFPYIGDLDPLFNGLSGCVEPGTVLAFSTEHLEGEAWDFAVGAHKRFAHASGCIDRTLAKHSWSLTHRDAITVRMEEDAPVPGELIVAIKL
ncbi:MAG: methyltransferase domain-containing protein [Pseudomonadota bacterium]